MWGGGQFSNLFYQRSIYYEAPGQADGPQRLAEMQAPLELSLQGIELSEPTGTIVVRKDAVPDDPQDFSFTAGGGLSPASFQLDDDSDPTLSNTQTFDERPGRQRLLDLRDGPRRLGRARAPPATTAARARTSTSRPARPSPARS